MQYITWYPKYAHARGLLQTRSQALFFPWLGAKNKTNEEDVLKIDFWFLFFFSLAKRYTFRLCAITQNVCATWPDPTRVFLSGEEKAWERVWPYFCSKKLFLRIISIRKGI